MEWATGFLQTQGWAGVVVLGLSVAVIVLWRQNTALHEKRVSEAREGIKAIEANTAATAATEEAIETQTRNFQSFMETFRALLNVPARRGRGQ